MKFAAKAVLAAAAIALTAPLASANEDVIKLRDGVMRQNGLAIKIVAQMAQGKIDFDADLATAALSQIGNTASIYPALFPAGSEGGKAGPQIFSDPDGFAAASAKMKADADAAIEAVSANGLDGLRGGLGAVGGNCQSCHNDWRS